MLSPPDLRFLAAVADTIARAGRELAQGVPPVEVHAAVANRILAARPPDVDHDRVLRLLVFRLLAHIDLRQEGRRQQADAVLATLTDSATGDDRSLAHTRAV